MPEFIQINDEIAVAMQLFEEDIDRAYDQGFRTIVCNRPDHEEDLEDQPLAKTLERYALEKGMSFAHIPVDWEGPSIEAVKNTRNVLDSSDGPILAYCLTGGRSTKLWALAEAHSGKASLDDLIDTASQAGFNISAIRPSLESLAA